MNDGNSTAGDGTAERNYITLTSFMMRFLDEDTTLYFSIKIVLFIEIAIGYIVNILLVTLLLYSRRTMLEISVNILLMSMAVVDIALLTVMMVTEGIYFRRRGFSYENDIVSMEIKLTAIAAGVIFSSFTVSALSVLKFVAVFMPIEAKTKITKQIGCYIVAAACLITAAVTSPLIVMKAESNNLRMNDATTKEKSSAAETAIFYSMLIQSIAPGLAGITMVTTYIPIIYRLCHSNIVKTKLYQKAARHLSVIVIVFVFYLGFSASADIIWYNLATSHTSLLPPVSSNVKKMIKYVIIVSPASSVFHVILNPILHALITENYMELYEPLFCKWRVLYNLTSMRPEEAMNATAKNVGVYIDSIM